MRFLLDENLFAGSCCPLRTIGHDAIAAIEAGLAALPDIGIRDFAIREERVLITLDADSADLIRYPAVGTPGVIHLKVHPPDEQVIQQLIHKAAKLATEVPIDGALMVLHRDLIRIRR